MDEGTPVIIRDNEQFATLVNAWRFSGIWDEFSLVYENTTSIPARLRGFTIIANDDVREPYGALLQIEPPNSHADSQPNYAKQKLLAKIRLS